MKEIMESELFDIFQLKLVNKIVLGSLGTHFMCIWVKVICTSIKQYNKTR